MNWGEKNKFRVRILVMLSDDQSRKNSKGRERISLSQRLLKTYENASFKTKCK